jgi:hypothetical protein
MKSNTTAMASGWSATAIASGYSPAMAATGPADIRGSSRKRFATAPSISLSTAKRSCSASTASPTSTPYIDVLAGGGDDMRDLPLSMRKANLARLLARGPDGIFIAPFEQGEIGPDLFRATCRMGLEGLVSKRRDRGYRGGPCSH